LHQALLSLKEEIPLKNKRLFALLFAMVMILTTMPVFASPGRIPQSNEPVHSTLKYTAVYIDGARYYSGQVVFEVFWINSGELVSREYFDVLIHEDELTNEYAPIAPLNTMPETTIWLPPAAQGALQTVGTVSTGSILGHSRRVNFHSGPSLVFVGVETNWMGNDLGNANLSPGQYLRISVPFNTLSYTVLAGDLSFNGGWATFSVTE
jgi:hypothetical protein